MAYSEIDPSRINICDFQSLNYSNSGGLPSENMEHVDLAGMQLDDLLGIQPADTIGVRSVDAERIQSISTTLTQAGPQVAGRLQGKHGKSYGRNVYGHNNN
ncbi:364_t:CDS:2 [Racocetra fulgida]|uniref:364_t:CDS:1 n=1 Tax=Racocetra fulgida TaxID=60492 RepID=A0A9N8WEB8_9GLOM|nr:364_t:CDS:2 [Racocetra fulgida]